MLLIITDYKLSIVAYLSIVDSNLNEDVCLLPDIAPTLKQFEDIITWKSLGNKKVPEPNISKFHLKSNFN